MKKISARITNDFKQSSKRKVYDSEVFVAGYGGGEYFRVFIDREDDRRIVITFTGDELRQFSKMITSSMSVNAD